MAALSLQAALAVILAGLALPAAAWAAPPGAPALPLAAPCRSGTVVSYLHSLVIGADEAVCGDVDMYGGSVRVLGHVGGSVTAFGGNITVVGEVDGNVTAFGGSVVLEPGARVAGDVETWAGAIQGASRSSVSGSVEHGDQMATLADRTLPGFSGPWQFPWPWVLGWTLLAAVVITLFPGRTARVRVVARFATLRSMVVGVLTTVLGVVLAALLFATCIGAPISLVVVAGLLAGWALGTVAVALWLGEQIMHVVAPGERSSFLSAVLGMAVLSSAESLPGVGGVVMVVTGSLGLGASLLSRYGARRAVRTLPASLPARS
jgi:hypothetical protein